MIQKNTSCECPPIGKLERPRFFPQQLVTPEELNLQQDYFRSRMRLHNLLLHGWGVVCGLSVGKKEGMTVCVQGGFAIGPCGDDILIEQQTVDIDRSGQTGSACEPAPLEDPYCSQKNGGPKKGSVFLAVKYKQIMTRPVKVQPTGCGGAEAQCEFSRYQDCFEFGVLDDCPPDHSAPSKKLGFQNPHCPPMANHPWVVLAKINIKNGKIDSVENCACRRIVRSHALVFGNCRDDIVIPDPGSEEIEKPVEGDKEKPDKPEEPMTDKEKAAAERRARELEEKLKANREAERAGLSRLTQPASQLKGIGVEKAAALKRHFGLARELTTADILVIGETEEKRKEIADALPGSLEDVTRWVNQADLMRIEGMTIETAKVLADSDRTIEELAKLSKAKQTATRTALAKKTGGVKNLPEPLKNVERLELLVSAAKLVVESDKLTK